MRSEVKPPYLLYLLIVVHFNVANGQQSPCPNIFDYKFDGQNWYGTITLPSVGRGRTNLMVTLSIEDSLNNDNSGQLLLQSNTDTLYATIDAQGLLEYKVVFPISAHIPTVKSIKLNKIEYCNNPIGSGSPGDSTITLIHSFQTDTKVGIQPIPQFQPEPQQQPVTRPPPQRQPVTRPPPQRQPVTRPPPRRPIIPPSSLTTHSRPALFAGGDNDVSWLEALPTSSTCGVRTEGPQRPIQLIINGEKVEPGAYPWVVALNDQTMRFICGGNLVSTKKVISAAHCIGNAIWLYVELGRHNREDKTEDYIFRIGGDIKKHPDYKPNTGHGDISVLTLTEEVKISDKVTPICLWHFGLGGIGMKGTVVGWGSDLSGDATVELMQTDVDIVPQDICVKSNALFKTITSANTFCAGGKGTGPCRGDSGGGMFINVENHWYLRGIISHSIGRTANSCDVNLYAVYVDVATYLDWLKSQLA